MGGDGVLHTADIICSLIIVFSIIWGIKLIDSRSKLIVKGCGVIVLAFIGLASFGALSLIRMANDGEPNKPKTAQQTQKEDKSIKETPEERVSPVTNKKEEIESEPAETSETSAEPVEKTEEPEQQDDETPETPEQPEPRERASWEPEPIGEYSEETNLP